MSFKNITSSEKRALSIATAGAFLFGCFFLKDFFTMFVIAGVMAYLFGPVNQWLKKRMHKGSAVGLTFIVSLLVIVIPLVLIIIFAVVQTNNMLKNLGDVSATVDLNALGNRVITTINNLLSQFSFISYRVTEESLVHGIESVATAIGNSVIDSVSGFAGNIVSLITSFIIYIFVFVSFLSNGPKLVAMFRELNPLGNEISDLYLARTAAMVKGTVRGQFIIAILQGFVGAVSVALAGWPEPFFLFFIILSVLSVIPLGGGVILIPLGILMILFGNVTGGLIILGTHFLLTTNIDNFLRPILVPKEARIDAALMIVSVFAGIGLFGFLGIIIGPTIMVLIVTTIRVYLEVYRGISSKSDEHETDESILTKIGDMSKHIFRR